METEETNTQQHNLRFWDMIFVQGAHSITRQIEFFKALVLLLVKALQSQCGSIYDRQGYVTDRI